ncbi:hypothetical protein [Celeribacter sp.]|jgi:hypothetical protein|uniref:hypothetical protein n=1 Tax=Celeribacter sp. TaxID=1890673 RepID=UPI003A94DB87
MYKYVAVAFLLLAACAESIPEVSYYDGRNITIQMRATPESNWEVLIDGEIVVQEKTKAFSTNETLHGMYKGKPVMVRRYLRSNGWTSTHVADVFIDGQLVETLVLQ